MTTRRKFFSWVGASAAVLPVQANAQEDLKPPCRGVQGLSGAWSMRSSVSNVAKFNKGEERAELRWELITSTIGKQLKGFDGVEDLGTNSGEVTVQPINGGGLMISLKLARLTLPVSEKKTKSISDDMLLWRPSHLDFYFDQSSSPDARIPNVDGFFISYFRMSPDFQAKMLSSEMLYANLVVSDLGVVQMAFRVRGLQDALDMAPGVVSANKRKLNAAGGCKTSGGCMMTTAAVGMLGRADDCFELTQMRRLRARFGHEAKVLEAYLTASEKILTQLPSRRVSARILLFYGAVVWPTAIMVRLGAMRSARSWYLGGFNRLMSRFART